MNIHIPNSTGLARAAWVPVLVILLALSRPVSSQNRARIDDPLNVSGSVSVTNDGISTIPSLSLGKPAGILNLSIGKRFHFDPIFRFSLRGEPWGTVFRFRYDAVDTERLLVLVGTAPILSFKTQSAVIDEVTRDAIEARRMWGFELYTSYELAENLNVGTHTLHSRGFDESVPDYTYYMSVYGDLADIPILGGLRFSVRPQFFYLRVEEDEGWYIASSFRLELEDFPLSVSSIVNRSLETEITGNPDLLWNVSLDFSFEF